MYGIGRPPQTGGFCVLELCGAGSERRDDVFGEIEKNNFLSTVMTTFLADAPSEKPRASGFLVGKQPKRIDLQPATSWLFFFGGAVVQHNIYLDLGL